jgi:hypothetical protein
MGAAVWVAFAVALTVCLLSIREKLDMGNSDFIWNVLWNFFHYIEVIKVSYLSKKKKKIVKIY